MHKAYASAYGTTIIREEDKEKIIRETHDKIEEELLLENEIEIIEENIAFFNQEKGKLGTIKSIKKYKNANIILNILLFFFAILLGQIFGTALGAPIKEITFNLYYFNINTMALALSPLAFIGSLGFLIKDLLYYRKKEKHLLNIIEQLEFLNNELAKKREKLEELRTQSKKESITDTTIHSIDNSRYRASLKERLDLLSYIKKYRDNLNKHLANGTLDEELRELEIQPENIPFVKETLMRILEKK